MSPSIGQFLHLKNCLFPISIGLGVIGLKLMADLREPLKRLSIDIEKDAEIDITNFYCNGDTVNIVFGECKVLQSLQKTSLDQIKKKVKASLFFPL